MNEFDKLNDLVIAEKSKFEITAKEWGKTKNEIKLFTQLVAVLITEKFTPQQLAGSWKCNGLILMLFILGNFSMVL